MNRRRRVRDGETSTTAVLFHRQQVPDRWLNMNPDVDGSRWQDVNQWERKGSNVENQSMRRNNREKYLLIGLFLLIYLLPLGARDLTVPDETRYAEIPREMIATGDWLVPRLNGVRYFEKPVMGYWIHAASILIFGENNFAVRLPSALSVGLSAMLIFWLVGRAVDAEKRRRVGVAGLAGIVFLSCFEVFGVGNTAVLDNLFALFLTAAIAAFYTASERPPGTAAEKGWLLLAGLACGTAFLTKGFLGVVLPILVLVPFLAWERRIRDIVRMGWLPLLTAALVVLPWAVAMGRREPDFWPFFFWNEHIRRFLGHNAQHTQPLWYFFMLAPAMFLPWTFLAPAAVKGLRQTLRSGNSRQRLIRLCICWLVLPFLFFSASKGKLLTYILPCFPPFAILLAVGLAHAVHAGQRRSIQWGIAGTGLLFVLAAVAVAGLQIFGGQGLGPFNHSWKALMAVNALLSVAVFCGWALTCRMSMKKLAVFGGAPLLLFFMAHFTLPDAVIDATSPGPLLEHCRPGIGKDAVVIADEDSVRAVCWYLKRSDLRLYGGGGELDYGMAYPDAGNRALHPTALKDLIRQHRGKVVLIGRSKHVQNWKDGLPKPVFIDTNGPDGFSLWKY